MNFIENLHGFEYITFIGEPTLRLSLFAMALFSICMDGDDWRRMRSVETQKAMLMDRELLGGTGGVAKALLQEIGGRPTAWIKNRYPYDGLYPLGSRFAHECYYKNDGILSMEEMMIATIQRFPDNCGVIFHNGLKRKSIQTIEHAHAIIDPESRLLRL